VKVGTPVRICRTQSEDATLGAKTSRPQDFNDDDPPNSVMTSPSYFEKLKAGILQ
jgi:hypothetical protein